MKILTSTLQYFSFILVSALTAKAQTLSPGDIAIVGFNFDNADQIAFVALAEIPSGTEIKFTDNGWKSDDTFRANEGTATYTAASTIAAGTVVYPTLAADTYLGNNGDQVLAYQGDNSSPTFIYALNSEGTSGTWQSDATSTTDSALPAGLTNGTNAIAFPEVDNGYYSGTTTGTAAELLAAISDPNNWTTSNSRIDSSNWPTSFTVSGGGGDPVSEEAITLSATPATVDEGSALAVTLSVPTNVDSDTVFSLTSGGDGTELSIPTTATILTGTNSVTFDVSGLSDSEYDVDTAVTITATLAGYTSSTLDITVVDTDFASLTAIRTEDFETDGQGTRYTASTPFSSTANDHWNRTDGTDISNISGAYSSFSGTYFWATEDTDYGASSAAANDIQTLDITGISITGASALQFRGLFGSGNERGAGASAYDSVDYIKVQAQIDGGGYSDVIWFAYLKEGRPSSDYTNEPLGVDRDFDGKADSADDLLGTALQPYVASISGTGSTLDLRIQVHMEIGDEEIAFDNIQVLGLVSDDEAITLSSAATTVDEGSTLAVTLSVPTNVDSDTVFNLSSDGDGSELSIPTTVTIPTGTNSVDFNVSGLGDATYDNNQTVKITADLTGYISTYLNVSVVDTDSRPPMDDIIFTQYYEGTSLNKWIEISNIGNSSVDLSNYQVTLWGSSTANTEAWKTDGGTPNITHSLSGVTLAAGESYVIANSSATLPYSSSLADVNDDIAIFNGDDSLVLYSDPTGYLVSNILDAISFTVVKEGEDKGFVRTSASYGFDFNSGSSIEDYDDDNSGPAVWTQITTATADAAVDGDDAYLGSTGLVTAADPVADYLTLRSLTSDDLTTDSNGNGFTVLEEYLAGFGDGSGPDAISYGIVNNALTLTSDLESEPSGITVALQATSDLSVAFSNVASTISTVDNTDGTYTRSYTETDPPAGGQRFLRLSITTD
jgi:hypothetical protein